MAEDKGLRYNEGKLRYDLVNPFAHEQMVKILTKGSLKYNPRNWELGMCWSKVISSLKRHLAAIENGEDYDKETSELHAAHLACNAHFLTAYYSLYPQGDDRQQWYKKPLKRVWLDIDGVCADFEQAFLKYLDLPLNSPEDWNDYRFRDNFEKVKDDNNFWLTIPSLINPSELTYPIEGYCTARVNCKNEVTQEWLNKNGYPKGKLINVNSEKKSEVLKDICDVMVDDSIRNFIDLNSSNILCFLMTRPHNEKYTDVGHLRVNNIVEFINKIK